MSETCGFNDEVGFNSNLLSGLLGVNKFNTHADLFNIKHIDISENVNY